MKPANDNFLLNDVANLEAAFADLLAAYPELQDDEELRADMIEGSTRAFDVLTRLVNAERDSDGMAKAITARIAYLDTRKVRALRRKEAMRSLILRIMKAGSIPRAALAEATVSIGKGRDSVEITDETKLPEEYVKVTTTPDKTAIKAALDAGKKVSGAEIKTGGETLTLRVK